MRLFVAAVLLLVPLAFARKNEMLLGGDDVDRTHADMEGQDPIPAPANFKDLKQKAKTLKTEMTSDKNKMRELKRRLKAAELAKADKKALRKEYNGLKTQVGTLKHEMSATKAEIGVAKSNRKEKKEKNEGKKQSRGRGHKNKKGGKKSRAEVDDEIVQMTKDQKKEARRALRRRERQGKAAGGEMKRLRSRIVHSEKKTGHGKNRVRCALDSDCSNGAQCLANRKGKKFCRGGHKKSDKTVGEKCTKSEQCARGLKCYVLNDAQVSKHGKKKGHCMGPTADLTKGTLLPFNQH